MKTLNINTMIKGSLAGLGLALTLGVFSSASFADDSAISMTKPTPQSVSHTLKTPAIRRGIRGLKKNGTNTSNLLTAYYPRTDDSETIKHVRRGTRSDNVESNSSAKSMATAEKGEMNKMIRRGMRG